DLLSEHPDVPVLVAEHCSFMVAGAGYAGVETAAARQLFTRRLLPRFISLRPEHLRWVLADVAPHALAAPEVNQFRQNEFPGPAITAGRGDRTGRRRRRCESITAKCSPRGYRRWPDWSARCARPRWSRNCWSWCESAPRRSTAAPTAWRCTTGTPAPAASTR